MVDQGVIDSVKDNLAKGYTLDQIKKALAKSGWSEQEIKEAIASAGQESPELVQPDVPGAAPAPSATPGPAPTHAPEVKPLPGVGGERPTAVTVLAILFFIFGGLGAVYSVLMMVGSAFLATFIKGFGSSMVVAGVFGLIMSFLDIFAGWGLLKLKKWAWTIALILSILGIIGLVPIIFIVILIKTKDSFS